MKICISSDSHDNRRLMDHVVKDAKARGAEVVLQATWLRVLKKQGLQVHVIHGNNVGDIVSMSKLANEAGSKTHREGLVKPE